MKKLTLTMLLAASVLSMQTNALTFTVQGKFENNESFMVRCGDGVDPEQSFTFTATTPSSWSYAVNQSTSCDYPAHGSKVNCAIYDMQTGQPVGTASANISTQQQAGGKCLNSETNITANGGDAGWDFVPDSQKPLQVDIVPVF